jgi:hypothetical protein
MGGMILCDRCRKTTFSSSAKTISDRVATHLNGTYCSGCYSIVVAELRAWRRKAYGPPKRTNKRGLWRR